MELDTVANIVLIREYFVESVHFFSFVCGIFLGFFCLHHVLH